MGGWSWRLRPSVACVAAGLALVRRLEVCTLCLSPVARGERVHPAALRRREARDALVARRATILRPVGGPPPKKKIPFGARPHIPVGALRLIGPIRRIPFKKSVTETLELAVDLTGRGGLAGRYRDEVMVHLAEMRELRERGTPMEATVFWDFENMGVYPQYQVDPFQVIDRWLRWISGVVDAPVTSVEAVEFTRHSRTPQWKHASGEVNWLSIMRQMGAIVHRAWPKMTNFADVILLDRIRALLDKIKDGGDRRIICLFSGDKGFIPMLEAAQSEGTTILLIADRGESMEAHYFPGGCDFSVPIRMPRWRSVKFDVMSKKLDALRPAEEWTLEQGPQRWNDGTVALQPAPEEELDRRIFHDFIDRETWTPNKAKFTGQFVRPGLRLNDTLAAALQRALAREGTVGTRTGRLPPEAHEALERDLADLSLGLDEDRADVFWNFQNMPVQNAGPPQQEMLGRIVRWFEGVLGMPVQRVEVSRFVEPWEKFGAYGLDWLFSMQKLGIVIHRVWPPRSELANAVLTRSIGALAKAAAQSELNATEDKDEANNEELPRVVCLFSQDLYFDEHMRASQRAGISAVWLGPEGKGFYYPAKSNSRIRIDILEWDTAMAEIAWAECNPFIPGASTPDAPRAIYSKPLVPANFKWGRPDELELYSTRLRVSKEVLRPVAGISA